MKKISMILVCLMVLSLLAGCGASAPQAQVAATTLPVYTLTSRLLDGTGISCTRLVTEQVSCLHDYSLNIDQVRASESAQVIVISGAGLEDFLGDMLKEDKIIDASAGISLLPAKGHHHEDGEECHDHHDPHIWLSPVNAQAMAKNICEGLSAKYPDQAEKMNANLETLLSELAELQTYGEENLKDLSCRELVTFHDGFAYLAQAFDLTLLRSIEEEHGSEASAKDLTDLIALVREHSLPAIFTEQNGSSAAASVIASETGVKTYALTTAMSGDDYFSAMRHNIDTLKEALK